MLSSSRLNTNPNINNNNKLQEIKEEEDQYLCLHNNYNKNYNNFNTINTSSKNYNNKPPFNERYGNNTITTNTNNYTNENEDQTQIVTNSNNFHSRSIGSILLNSSSNNKFLSKVIIENVSPSEKVFSLLENFLQSNNYSPNYGVKETDNHIEITFPEEEVAFNFTKLIHQQKNRAPSFYNVNVHLSLVQNLKYGKGKNYFDSEKKKGLSSESIQRLFNGFGVISKNKEEKKNLKINGNLDLGISSPFLYPFEKKKMRSKNKNNKNIIERNRNKSSNINKSFRTSCNSSNSNISLEKFKDYNKLNIRVLDTHYCPLADHNFRPEEKNKWVSPSNFK